MLFKAPFLTVLALSSIWIASALPTFAPVRGFVKTNGTKLQVEGRDFYFAGTNNFDMLLPESYSDMRLKDAIALHASKGLSVLRVFCHSNGDGAGQIPTPNALQPSIGVFNEVAFQRLDLLLSEAGRNGIRLILPLANYEPFLGGIDWYVDQVLGHGHDKELFYTDPTVIAAYKSYVRHVITRNNTITGVKYIDDPAIMAWECANEPHTSDLYELNRGMAPGAIVRAWLDNVSAFIKSLDPNHLVCTGEEGYRADGDSSTQHNNWINGGFKGVDFVGNIALRNIDFATVHVYPDNWEIEAWEASWVGPNFIADRAAIAHAAGKPIVMEEFGAKRGYMASREAAFQMLLEAAATSGYAGALVWQLQPYPVLDDATYNFDYTQSGSESLLAAYSTAQQLSSGPAADSGLPAGIGSGGAGGASTASVTLKSVQKVRGIGRRRRLLG